MKNAIYIVGMLFTTLVVGHQTTNTQAAITQQVREEGFNDARDLRRRRIPPTRSPTRNPTNAEYDYEYGYENESEEAPLTPPPTTKPPTTTPPTTKPPTTKPPTTTPPTTKPPTTTPPTTKPPTTTPPTTKPPTTTPPTTPPTNTQTGAFNIQLILDMPAEYMTVFNAAKAKWESIITNDIQSQYIYRKGSSCWDESWTIKSADIVVDDLLIFGNTPNIDGVNNILGQAGFCRYTQETNGRFMPRVGMMSFDIADMNMMKSEGILDLVILHEMGHVLGIGTLWTSYAGLITTSTFTYNGNGGVTGNQLIGRSGKPLIENNGGQGTALSHWEESIYGLETMSGYATKGSKLSKLTVLSLQDLGYTVNADAAEPYTPSGRRLRGSKQEPRKHKYGDDVIRKKPVLDKSVPYKNGKPVYP